MLRPTAILSPRYSTFHHGVLLRLSAGQPLLSASRSSLLFHHSLTSYKSFRKQITPFRSFWLLLPVTLSICRLGRIRYHAGEIKVRSLVGERETIMSGPDY